MELNAPAADFQLRDVDGRVHRLSDYRGRLVIVNFWSCECPHSERTDRSLLELAGGANDDMVLIAIAPNQNEAPADIKSVSRSRALPLVLLDPGHEVADRYAVQTTPDVYLIDRGGVLRYRGAVDDVTFQRREPSRFYLQEAIQALLRGELPPLGETPAYGCAIVREALE